MKAKNYLLLAIAIILLQACTIDQDINFNTDYSGTSSLKWSVNGIPSEFSKYMPNINTDEFSNEIIEKIIGNTELVEGISNIEFIKIGSTVKGFSFKFSNLEALNKLYALEQKEKKKKATFKGKNKTFKMQLQKIGMENSIGDNKLFQTLLNDVELNINIHFPNEIKKIKGDNIYISEDRHKLKKRINIMDFMQGKVLVNDIIKLK